MLNQRTLVEQAGAGAGWVSETDVSKRDYTLLAIHCMYSRSGRKGLDRVVQVPAEGGRRKANKTGRAWTDMYEAASQAGGGRVQGKPGSADRLLCSRSSGEK